MKKILLILLTLLIPFYTFATEEYDSDEIENPSDELFSKGSEFDNLNDIENLGSLTHLDEEPSGIVNNSVNVVSGAYMDSETDITALSPEPLQMQRIYLSSDRNLGTLGKGWNSNNFVFMNIEKEFIAYIIDCGGSSYSFEIPDFDEDKHHCKMQFCSFEKGVTNSGSGKISGRTYIKNTRLYFNPSDKHYYMIRPTGSALKFQKGHKKHWWVLESETQSNGNRVDYSYGKDHRVSRMRAFGSGGNLLGSLKFRYYKTDEEDVEFLEVKTHDDRVASYRFEKFKGKSDKGYYITSVQRPTASLVEYTYETKEQQSSIPRIVKKRLPNYRTLETQYYKKGINQVGKTFIVIDSSNDPRLNRVKYQKAPVGTDTKLITTHRFFYDLEKTDHGNKISGSTHVLDALKHRTSYEFESDQRLRKITKYTGTSNHSPYTYEKLFWADSENYDACSLLKARTFATKEEWIQFAKTFSYDSKGNVLCETLYGNLSGWNKNGPNINEKGDLVDNGCEKHQKHYTYTQDDKHLVLSSKEGENQEFYSYKPGTDLITQKLYSYRGTIYKREFWEYDGNGVVIKETVDNGSSNTQSNFDGITQRLTKYITPTQTYPLGLPKVVEEKYLDLADRSEKLLQKSINTYSKDGFLLSKEIYDANNLYSHTLYWEYNFLGNVTKEIDALGQVTIREYDANGNKFKECGPNLSYHKEFIYDFSNRLTKVVEKHNDGNQFINSFRYDYLNNKVASIDMYGNETRLFYDDFNRLIKTVHTEVENENGTLITPSEMIDYDTLSHPILTIDAKGCKTTCMNTTRGKPFIKHNPDGTEERWIYNLDGTLKTHVATNGVKTNYKYDGQKRAIQQEICSPSGELLSSTSSTYDAFNILSETDPKGYVKHYKYDGAGRLIETRKGDSRETFAYDALGRKYKSCTYFGPGETDCIFHLQVFDLLNRVTHEQTEDGFGSILTKSEYAYDEEGHRILSKAYLDAGIAETKTIFNSQGQPILVTDALGNETRMYYRYDYRNEYNQIVPYTEITDPMGNLSVDIKDTLGRTTSLIKKDPYGQIKQKKKIFYDANGNICRQIDTVITDGASDREIITTWTYDSANRLVALYEAVGTPEQKETRLTYNAIGQKENVINSDGTILKYEYDYLGRVSCLKASDGSVHYTYEYDQNNNLLKVIDHINEQCTQRSYNQNNFLINEILGNGLSLNYTYDAMGRTRKITLPDDTGFEYVYEASRIKEVRRLAVNQDILYAHTYQKYDLEGKLISSKLIGDIGSANFTYDILGRLTKIAFPNWEETIGTYDKIGNILQKSVKDVLGNSESTFTYNDLYQLKNESGATEHTYCTDSLYNRIAKDNSVCSINSLNQLLNDGENSYTYDLNGNITQKGSVSYVYDALNRLIKVTKPNFEAIYKYDAFNRRLSKTLKTWNSQTNLWNEVKERYIYCDQNEIGMVDASGKIIELRILGLGLGAEIGAAISLELKGKTYAPIHDNIGNVVAIVDLIDGETSETYRYSAFGEEQLLDEFGNDLEESINPWRFSSKRVDPETGLICFGRRYYDSTTGRWTTQDPIGNEGGPNLYAYVLNNPLTHFDAYGLYEQTSSLESRSGIPSFMSGSFSKIAEPISRFSKQCTDSIGAAVTNVIVSLPTPPVMYFDAYEYLPYIHTDSRGTHLFAKSDYYTLGLSELSQNLRFGTVNGIFNNFDDCLENVTYLSKLCGGCNIEFVHNATHGLWDFGECLLNRMYIATNPVRKIHQMWDNFFSTASDSANFFHLCHSQGAIHTKNALLTYPEERRQRILVLAIAPAAYIDPRICGQVVHVRAQFERDPIPYSDIIGAIIARDTIYTLDSHPQADKLDHSINSPTYANEIKFRYRNYIKTDGANL